jgi:hypothetical protein
VDNNVDACFGQRRLCGAYHDCPQGVACMKFKRFIEGERARDAKFYGNTIIDNNALPAVRDDYAVERQAIAGESLNTIMDPDRRRAAFLYSMGWTFEDIRLLNGMKYASEAYNHIRAK